MVKKNEAGEFDPDETYLDEVVMYLFMSAGFTYQLLNAFAIPFPVNIVLLPVTIIEYVLRWQVTFGSIPAK